MRNGPLARISASTRTVSSHDSSVVPWYHGIFADVEVTLSPSSADIGIAVMFSIPSGSANARYSSTSASYTPSS